ERERLAELVRAFGRQRDVVRVAADGTVVVIGRNGVEGAAAHGHAPEAAPRRLRAREPGHAGRRRGSEGDGDGPPLKAERRGKLLLDAAIVGHHWPRVLEWSFHDSAVRLHEPLLARERLARER